MRTIRDEGDRSSGTGTRYEAKAVVQETERAKAIGVSDLAAVERLLVGKGVTEISFMPENPNHRVRVEAGGVGYTGADLSVVVRAVDAARRG